MKFVEEAVAALGARMDDLLDHRAFSKPVQKVDMQSQLEDVASRIDRMEMLLLRTPLPDFKVLDDTIATLLSQSNSTAFFDISEIEVSEEEKVACKSEVNISINPDYMDQFCIDEADAPTDHANMDGVDRSGPCKDILCKSSLEKQVCAASCCKAF